MALVNVATLVDARARHWDITLRWDAVEIAVAVRDRHDHRTRPLEGRWRPPASQ